MSVQMKFRLGGWRETHLALRPRQSEVHDAEERDVVVLRCWGVSSARKDRTERWIRFENRCLLDCRLCIAWPGQGDPIALFALVHIASCSIGASDIS